MEFQLLLGFLHLVLMISVYAVGQQGKQGPLCNTGTFVDAIQPPFIIGKIAVNFFHVLFQIRQPTILFRVWRLDCTDNFYDPVTRTGEG